MKTYERQCPYCPNIITYKSQTGYCNGKRNNARCKECVSKHKTGHACYQSEVFREKLSKAFTGRKVTWKEKTGINRNCDHCGNEYYVIKCRIGKSKFCSNQCSSDHRLKENPLPFVRPSVNPLSSEFFEFFNRHMKLNGQHGVNGGEYYVRGKNRWIDYYNHEFNYIIEWDEENHNWGKYKEADKIRERELIEHLNCSFYRIKQKDFTVVKIHENIISNHDFDKAIQTTLDVWRRLKANNITHEEEPDRLLWRC